MHIYSMGYDDILKMPIYTFWELSKQVEKIRSVNDKRMFLCVSNIMGEKSEHYIEQLDQNIGNVVVVENKFDREGFNRLKRMMGAQ